ncbi:dipeptidase [Aureibacillus halotolerans]|uniref:Membrane dipeptidase n=1 Tax=Aureibacillus halotolerans TaxID=1508390 RepID=A0A4R6U1K3_9BACI|nr:membrane dipeptidase [Aureibacillus halotolerans]TDQ38299.1 membrane dipeptidase [Aureibacillus halotolerans]
MKKKAYNGYKSFQYLESGKDYKPYPLAKEINRVEPFNYPVNDSQEQEVQAILEEEYIISLHEHTFVCPEDVNQIFEFRRQGRDWTGYEGLSVSGLDVVFENFMDGTALITSQAGWKWNDVIHDLGIRYSDFAHQDMVVRAHTLEDIERAKKEGKIAFVTSLESATQIENEIDRVDVLYGLGVRVMGIAYSEGNSLGGGLKEDPTFGLTKFGHKVVERMNKLGMTIDVSHCNDRTALDTIEASSKPIFITHVGARALWNTNRMKPDNILKACAERGGVIGIEAAPHTTLTEKHIEHNLESVMEHFEHCVKLCGIDHVSFGLDTLYGDHVGLHHAFANQLSIGDSHKGQAFDEVAYVEGVENPSEAYINVVRWLVDHEYTREDIRKVMGQNILRVLKDTWVK